jgi:hypothetical protein
MRKPSIVLLGGLGNQLFQLAFMMSRNNSKEIFIETSLGSPRKNSEGLAELLSFKLPDSVQGVTFRSNLFSRKFFNITLRYSLISNRIPKCLNVLVYLGLSFITTLSLRSWARVVASDQIGLGNISTNRIRSSDLCVGYFQSDKYVSSEVLTQLKKLELNIESEVLQGFRLAAFQEHPIMLHVRLGDYVNEPGIGILPVSYYFDAIEKIRKTHPKNPIWVFSDEIEKARTYLDKSGTELEFIKDNWNSSAITFEVMRLGSAYIIANSTFSYWAAMLSREEKPVVIAPDPWFMKTQSPNQIIPNHWDRIQLRS